MSYRYRFAITNKNIVDKMRNMSYPELVDYIKNNIPEAYEENPGEDIFICVWNMFKQVEVFDMGDCPYCESIIEVSEKLFKNPDTDEYLKEYNIYLCTEEAILKTIEGMRELIVSYYRELAKTPELIPGFLKNKSNEWENLCDTINVKIDPEKAKKINNNNRPYSLDKNKKTIVRSNTYEYAIFEMVNRYKNLDLENNYLLFYGW